MRLKCYLYIINNAIRVARPSELNYFLMLPSFVCSVSNVLLGLVFSIYFDAEFNEYQVRSAAGAILFRAESESLARYGIRTYHTADYCGGKITENGVK